MQSCIHEMIVLLGASSVAASSLKTRSTTSLISCGDNDIMSSKADLGPSPFGRDALGRTNVMMVGFEKIGCDSSRNFIGGGGLNSRGLEGFVPLSCFIFISSSVLGV